MNIFTDLIFTSDFAFSIIRVSTPIIFASMGALISDRAGIVNIGLEGIMLLAALSGVIFSTLTGSAFIGLLGAMFIGYLVSSILAWFTLRLKTHIILGGIAINLFAQGGTIFILYLFTGDKGTSASLASKVLPRINIPLIENIPVLGQIISGHNVLTYVCVISVFGVWYLLKHTPLGSWIKAVGENPDAAKSVGIDVYKIQFLALNISGVLAAIGGAFLSMGYVSWFSRDMSAGRGWIALAAEAMGGGSVVKTTITALIFGMTDALSNTLQIINLPSELLKTIPYWGTLIGLTIFAIANTRKKINKKDAI